MKLFWTLDILQMESDAAVSDAQAYTLLPSAPPGECFPAREWTADGESGCAPALLVKRNSVLDGKGQSQFVSLAYHPL